MGQMFIDKVWVGSSHVYASTTDGTIASYPISQWPRIENATEQQLQDFYLTYGGIHWPQIDEDLSFEGMFANAGYCKRTVTEDSVCYIDS